METNPQTQPSPDLIIIGAGPGGYEAAAYAARQGLRVTIFEEREAGGTCLNRGCIPTKALVHSAEVMRTLCAEGIALTDSERQARWQQAQERKEAVVRQLREGVEAILQHPNITLVRGRAVIESLQSGERREESGERTDLSVSIVQKGEACSEEAASPRPMSISLSTLHSPLSSKMSLLLATGSHTKLLPIPGLDSEAVLTSDELLSIDHVPQSLCIVGAGVIGMEFASIFQAWGTEVTVVEYLKECLPALDSDVAKRLRKTMEKRGVRFVMQAAVKAIDGHRVTFDRKGKADSVEAEVILMATGRAPSVEGLGLEEAGVDFSVRGIAVDDNMQTSVPGIYAIGDCNARLMLAHAATFQGFRAVNHLLGQPDRLRLDIVPAAIFTYPEAASVGLSEDQAKAQGVAVKVGKAFHRSNGKALTMNETEGMVKLMADATTGRILGCHAFGAHAADMVQEVAAMMNVDATAAQLAATVHIHPTVGEVLREAAASIG